ncbi:MAG: pyroglutamyl-peptidase I [Oscillospiraceae bacterium]|nr:pyroglutamyl-peptidase I [Oscillospiraceae bacterium]
MKRILVTGFEPFGGAERNRSWEAVSRLPDRIAGFEIIRLRIPTVFGEGARAVMERADEIGADVILCVGEAGGRTCVTPEVIGINLRDARIPDNAGRQPEGEPVIPGAEDGCFVSLPVKRMRDAILARGVPCELSYTAGTFVCNDVLFTLLERYRGTEKGVGFIHVPAEGIPAERLSGALTAALESLAGEAAPSGAGENAT